MLGVQALSKYGDSGDGKLITSIHTKLEHSSRGGSFDTFTYGEKSNYKQDRASVAGFQASAGENWLFGEPRCKWRFLLTLLHSRPVSRIQDAERMLVIAVA